MTRAVKKAITLPEKTTSLLKKGVRMTNPFSVEVGDEVPLENIAGSLTIYGAARICGENTLIAEDVQLGYEAPVTLINCRLGPAVELKGGYFADSVFLERSIMGSNAQVRNGCLLEEETRGNHTVGLKQTILFPFVTLGSLINFCDCLMAGGTSRKNHSEVGSSYIHFNYTPRQDKATASLIGDVPRGVMLKENPIFLGGQGGIVGPVQIDYGTVIPAGIIYRKNTPLKGLIRINSDMSLFGPEFSSGVYGDFRRKFYLNVLYMANLLALKQWYLHVRQEFFRKQKFGAGLYAGAFQVLEGAFAERLQQMRLFVQKMETSLSAAEGIKKKGLPDNFTRTQKGFLAKWPQIEDYLSRAVEKKLGLKKRDAFIKIIQNKVGCNNSYLEAIKSLTRMEIQIGSDWLNQIVTGITGHCFPKINMLRQKEK
jgi:bifunctional UDP-N-acetylglucosamine pyrophosphorylase / glucosamine-1-phosphate N-acetyltransferase